MSDAEEAGGGSGGFGRVSALSPLVVFVYDYGLNRGVAVFVLCVHFC